MIPLRSSFHYLSMKLSLSRFSRIADLPMLLICAGFRTKVKLYQYFSCICIATVKRQPDSTEIATESSNDTNLTPSKRNTDAEV